MTIKELKETRSRLSRMHHKEYERLGNTQRSQELFAEIEKIDAEIEKMNDRSSELIIEIIREKNGYIFYKHIDGQRIIEDVCATRSLYEKMQRINNYYKNCPDHFEVKFILSEEV